MQKVIYIKKHRLAVFFYALKSRGGFILKGAGKKPSMAKAFGLFGKKTKGCPCI